MWLHCTRQGDGRHQSPASTANPDPESTINSPSCWNCWKTNLMQELLHLFPGSFLILSFSRSYNMNTQEVHNRKTTKTTQLAVCSWLYNAVIFLSLDFVSINTLNASSPNRHRPLKYSWIAIVFYM